MFLNGSQIYCLKNIHQVMVILMFLSKIIGDKYATSNECEINFLGLFYGSNGHLHKRILIWKSFFFA